MFNIRFLSAALSLTAGVALCIALDRYGDVSVFSKVGLSLCATTAVSMVTPIGKFIQNLYLQSKEKPLLAFNKYDVIGGVGLASNAALAVLEPENHYLKNLLISGLPTSIASALVVMDDIANSPKSVLWTYHSDGQHKKKDSESYDDENDKKNRVSLLPV